MVLLLCDYLCVAYNRVVCGCRPVYLNAFSINFQDFLNIVTVGDSKTGKSSLLCALKDGKLTNQEIPEFFSTFTHKMKVDGRKLELGLWDTSGDPKYEGLRRLSYPKCDAFIVCYSVNSRKSFENVSKVWLPELEKHGSRSVPVIIVAMKKDMRPRASLNRNGSLGINSDRPVPKERFVTCDEGMQLANDVHAYAFIECSAFSEKGVNDVFEQAVRAVLKYIKEEKAKEKPRRGSGGIRGLLQGK